jgi:RNA polymerase sigma-70 factor (ECF subfamily)
VSVVDVGEAITQAHREEWARVVAALTRRFGDLDIAEEAAAEAFATAVARWPADGVPPNPGGWLTTTANRKAIDRIRRENKRDDKQKEAQMVYDDDPPEPVGAIDDERLRLIFTCCHPALAMETRVALTLRMVGGLTVSEIARAFLVQETAMGQRITRAKAKIKAARIPYRVPSAEDFPKRVSGVLAVIFLVFNEGYLATGPDTDPVRHDLTAEAIRLTRLIRALMPEDGEVSGLLALMLLTEARRTARVSASGELVPLHEQDRGAWDAALIARATGWCASGWPPGWLRVATRSSPRSTPCTPPPATPTGRRSSPSTTSSSASTPPRSSPSTEPSRSPSSTARRWRWRPSTALRTSWPAITSTTQPALTCYADSAAVRKHARPTTKPST